MPLTGMLRPSTVMCFSALIILNLPCRSQEPSVKKESISIHTVQRGSMTLVAPASGSVTSLHPATAVLKFSTEERCEPGRKAQILVDGSKPFPARITKPVPGPACEVEISTPLPPNAKLDTRVEGLLEVGELKDVIFFARPADSSPNSTAWIFVLEPSGTYARRVMVRYGRMSGPLIQVLEGLAPGDRVIVTSMSQWNNMERVRIE